MSSDSRMPSQTNDGARSALESNMARAKTLPCLTELGAGALGAASLLVSALLWLAIVAVIA